jgi:hypothetical protein
VEVEVEAAIGAIVTLVYHAWTWAQLWPIHDYNHAVARMKAARPNIYIHICLHSHLPVICERLMVKPGNFYL